jgi:hypothetical protein
MTLRVLVAGCAWTCLLAIAPSCNRASSSSPESQGDLVGATDEVLSGCIVASGRGFAITMKDVEALQKHYLPAPDVGAATRLAIDVWLAEWIVTGEVDRLPLLEKIRHQQRSAVRERGTWAARLKEAAEELELQYGPCHVPRRAGAAANSAD